MEIDIERGRETKKVGDIERERERERERVYRKTDKERKKTE